MHSLLIKSLIIIYKNQPLLPSLGGVALKKKIGK